MVFIFPNLMQTIGLVLRNVNSVDYYVCLSMYREIRCLGVLLWFYCFIPAQFRLVFSDPEFNIRENRGYFLLQFGFVLFH